MIALDARGTQESQRKGEYLEHGKQQSHG